MKVKLIFPPLWAPTQPYLSVPSLVSFLLSKGIETSQVDFNLEMYEKILSGEFLNKCKEYLLSMPGDGQEDDVLLRRVARFAAKNVERYKDMFRNNSAVDIKTYKSCMTFFKACMKIVHTIYPDEKLLFNEFKSKYNNRKSEEVMRCLIANYEGTDDSLLSEILVDCVDNTDMDCDLLGISIVGESQVIPAFALIGIIKRKYPDTKIVLGGPIVSRWTANSNTNMLLQFYDYIDFIIRGEGEYALYSLILHLMGQAKIEEIPQVVYRRIDGTLQINPDGKPVDINELPPPVFNKNDIPRYFMPAPILPLLSNRGCYWGKCTFCDHSFIYNNVFRKKSAEGVLREMIHLQTEYNVSHFQFHDEAMLPSDMDAISRIILENGLSVKWASHARLDKKMTPDLFKAAYNAGLRALYLGLESINARVSLLMRKGIDVSGTKEILENAARAGIFIHLFYIRGFPGETSLEFKETADFILENKSIIGSAGGGEFSLGKHSPIAFEPEKYGLKICENSEDLSLVHKFVKIDQIGEGDKKEEGEAKDAELCKFCYGHLDLDVSSVLRDHWMAVDWNTIINPAPQEKLKSIV